MGGIVKLKAWDETRGARKSGKRRQYMVEDSVPRDTEKCWIRRTIDYVES